MENININDLEVKVKEFIEEEERDLHKAYDFKVVAGEKNLIMGIDSGSTRNRVTILSKESKDLNTQYNIPSVYREVPDDRELKPKTANLYNRLDSIIINQTSKTKTMFDKGRFIRGRKASESNFAIGKLNSIDQKIDTPAFYVNIIDAIGYAVAQKFNNEIPSKVNVVAGIALPPDDKQSSVNLDRFLNNIIGEYSWKHVDSGITVTINIEDVEVLTEPEAFVKAYYARLRQHIPQKVLVINTGGRSIGLELLDEGVISDLASSSINFGGQQFIKDLGSAYVSVKGGRAPSDEALYRAIKTGFLKRGSTTEDVRSYIEQVCQTFGTNIMNQVVELVLNRAGVPLTEIDEVIMCGGLSKGGDYNISIADFLGDLVESKSENTIFTVETENLIPFGLAFHTYMNNADFFVDTVATDSDEEAVDEE